MKKITHYLSQAESLSEILETALDLPWYFRNGACVGMAPEIFDGETKEATFEAKRTCATCPIQDLCLGWAAMTQDSGIWGGMTPSERSKYTRGNRPVDIGEIRMLETDRKRLMSNAPAQLLAAEFAVTERTIYRWRKKIQTTKRAS